MGRTIVDSLKSCSACSRGGGPRRKWRPIAGVSARVDKAMRRELIGHYCCVITRQLLETGSEESVKGHGVRGVSQGIRHTGPATLSLIWAFCRTVTRQANTGHNLAPSLQQQQTGRYCCWQAAARNLPFFFTCTR